MGRLPLLLLAFALSAAAVAASPPAAAHTCVGAHCGDCSGPGNHDHSYDNGTSGTACSSQGQLVVPAPGPAALAAGGLLAALVLARLSPCRRPS